MPTRFNWIRPLQEPFDLGLDTEGRARWVFNIWAQKDPSHTFSEELGAVLAAASVITWSGVHRNVMNGSKASRPAVSGAVLQITETGGTGPEYIQNSPVPAYRNPTAQILASADKAEQARAMIHAAFDALAVVSNASVTPLTA